MVHACVNFCRFPGGFAVKIIHQASGLYSVFLVDAALKRFLEFLETLLIIKIDYYYLLVRNRWGKVTLVFSA